MIKLARRAGDDKVFSGWLHFYLGLRYVALTSLSFFTGADLTRIRHPRVIGTDIAQCWASGSRPPLAPRYLIETAPAATTQ